MVACQVSYLLYRGRGQEAWSLYDKTVATGMSVRHSTLMALGLYAMSNQDTEKLDVILKHLKKSNYKVSLELGETLLRKAADNSSLWGESVDKLLHLYMVQEEPLEQDIASSLIEYIRR